MFSRSLLRARSGLDRFAQGGIDFAVSSRRREDATSADRVCGVSREATGSMAAMLARINRWIKDDKKKRMFSFQFVGYWGARVLGCCCYCKRFSATLAGAPLKNQPPSQQPDATSSENITTMKTGSKPRITPSTFLQGLQTSSPAREIVSQSSQLPKITQNGPDGA